MNIKIYRMTSSGLNVEEDLEGIVRQLPMGHRALTEYRGRIATTDIAKLRKARAKLHTIYEGYERQGGAVPNAHATSQIGCWRDGIALLDEIITSNTEKTP